MEPAIPAPRSEPPEQPEPASAAPAPPAPASTTGTEKPTKADPVSTPARTTRQTSTIKAAPAKTTPVKSTPAKAATRKAAGPAKATPTRTTTIKATPAKSAPAKATTTKAVPAKVGQGKAVLAKAATPGPATEVDQTGVKELGLDEAIAPGVAIDVPVEGYPASTWDRVRAQPWNAPEVLAQAAVARYGDEADRYARWVRATYPAASDERIAQAAVRRFVGQARRGALAGLLVGQFGEVVALTWLQSRMVLHIAAAYRQDPRDPQRATELLTVLGAPRAPVVGGVRAIGRRLASRLVPAAGLLIGVLANETSTEAVARRAIGLYRPLSRQP
jgi:uncharacterized protein (DUF697 family)